MSVPWKDRDAPPAYAGQTPDPISAEIDLPPPAYALPKTYKIGEKKTDRPLVDIYQLKLHLRLLRAFHDLRISVQNVDSTSLPLGVEKLNRSERWSWFLHLAVERFERWVLSLPGSYGSSTWAVSHAPPLDVLLVWHTYMLNPTWYAEDGIRTPEVAALPRSANTPLQLLIQFGDLRTYQPSAARIASWRDSTWTPFDPLEAMSQLRDKPVVCPRCLAGLLVPFFQDDGCGYAQQGFKTACPYCTLAITKETLGVAKLARDLARRLEPVQVDGARILPRQYLAGTVYTPHNATNVIRAKRLQESFLRAPGVTSLKLDSIAEQSDRAKAIQEKAQYSFGEAMIFGGRGSAVGENLRRRVMSAYSDDRIFSVELVGAVLRQESFIDKMVALGWTDLAYFDSEQDELALHHAVARYHAFLDLLATPPENFYVPTLDIDLAWHTHQLYPDQYAVDCKKYVGRYIDHDDRVGESRLSAAFDLTCRAWKSRFGIPYAYCGCPLPGDTIGSRVSQLRHRLLPSHSRSDLVPPVDNETICAGTHPSDHNAVYVLGEPDWYRRARKRKAMQRRERDKAEVQKGKMDRRLWDRGMGHALPFLVPVPLFPLGTCVAPCGSVLRGGPAGCATGMAACAIVMEALDAGEELVEVAGVAEVEVVADAGVEEVVGVVKSLYPCFSSVGGGWGGARKVTG
ncbi:hypothetical protein GLOTRDRAFT_125199 [Gloeophyllum trabeum ATCC 11539]|uniref:Uncharacterized protein n=1 Tax=Gloeophyllum trabeum (strain ATCC 11539 / FP-39264 / Madison 617) TaxID=670483 RepID=S7QI25_GLOTA|nr:uncharacterized protein GLOTRDRAFT_125199 [Gloeophyllum trabeum ATCC 11539]EPQ58878.1 hypothetical protein GLOTRDRAFT_125199 [Gloeophyllum trabeum ATCC 11539]